MKILDLDHQLSNAEVLHWTEQKRLQHAREDAEDRAAGITPKPRPANAMRMLEKTERHLKSDAYPYVKNPSAYKDAKQDDSIHSFGDLKFDRIQKPIFERYKDAIRKGLMTNAEAKDKMGEEQEKKELTMTELLMVHNLAPTNVEMLEPCIEEVEERFTKEELQIIVDCINEVFRADELKEKRKARKKEKKQAAKEAKKAEKEGEAGVVGDGEVTEIEEAIRDMTLPPARPLPLSGVAIEQDAPMAELPVRGRKQTGPNEEALGPPNRLE